MRLRWALCGLVVSTSLLLTACKALEVPKAAPSATPVPSVPTVSHPEVPAPKDRDIARLVAALTQVDSCALLDVAKAQAPGFTAADKFRRTSAHTCRITNARGDWVRIELATGSNRMSRFNLALDTIGGAKVYRDRPNSDTCEVDVPIAFEYSISIYSHIVGASPAALCRPVDAFAKVAVPMLAKASAPAKAPLAGWSGCALLSAIRGRPISALQIGGYPTNDLDGCTELDQGELITELSLAYGGELDPSMFERITPIGGHPTGVDSPGDKCRLTWLAGPSGQTGKADKFVQLIAMAKTCPQAEELAAKMKTALAGPIAKAPAPLYPIYLRPNEPDSDRPGGCADLDSFVVDSNVQYRCLPYVPVADPPKGATEVLRAVQADGNVACAISVEAVRKHLGAEFRPVTLGGKGCRFAEPSHGLEVAVEVSSRAIAKHRESKPAKVGKYSGWTDATELSLERYSVNLHVDRPEQVSLHVSFDFKPRRGTNHLGTAPEKQLIPLAAAIVNKYF